MYRWVWSQTFSKGISKKEHRKWVVIEPPTPCPLHARPTKINRYPKYFDGLVGSRTILHIILTLIKIFFHLKLYFLWSCSYGKVSFYWRKWSKLTNSSTKWTKTNWSMIHLKVKFQDEILIRPWWFARPLSPPYHPQNFGLVSQVARGETSWLKLFKKLLSGQVSLCQTSHLFSRTNCLYCSGSDHEG